MSTTQISSHKEPQLNNLKPILKKTQQKVQSALQLPLQSIKVSRNLFDQRQKKIILFAYSRKQDEQPPQEIMIMEQARKRIKREDQQENLTRMMNQISFDTRTERLFLSRINPQEKMEISAQIKSLLSVAHESSKDERSKRRQEMFASSKVRRQMDRASPEVMAKRTIRMVKLSSLKQGGSVKGVIQLGGKHVQYEDLLENQESEYYTLVKKKVNAQQAYPQIALQQHLYDQMQLQSQQQLSQKNQDDYDSNAQNNSDYDYPDEQDSRSSEGIIRDNDSYDSRQDRQQMDDDQLYRNYLRRVKQYRDQQMEDEQQYVDYDYQ